MNHMELPHYHEEDRKIGFIQEQLDHVDDFQMVADVFKQLCDTTRVRIFWLLCHCEECVLNISAMLEMSSPAVSHHLRPLKNSGLIVSRREGKEVYYRAADTEECRLLHQMIEQVMEITCLNMEKRPAQDPSGLETDYSSEQIEIVRAIHEQLTHNIGQRITIESLSKQYHMNPTTLKEVFKSVYGTSLAAHIKEHRMELAAQLLRETDLTIAQIGQRIGYKSQSRFSSAFKAYYEVLPTEYRKGRG